ncbi:MAG: hypothetical protein OK449_08975 [Thaumarchaeota archaeon]|nr:hypothetical protein [Nitrososphaerota archaeon]
MKLTSLINLAVFNGVAIILAALVYNDRVARIAYWHEMGFTANTAYYPLSYITSAVQGTDSIQGLLTVDWLQVILVVAVVVDASFAWGLLRRRRALPPGSEGPVSVPGAQSG